MDILPFIIIIASIIVFFLDEWAAIFNKIFSYFWVKLTLPIFLSSFCISLFLPQLRQVMGTLQMRLHALILLFFQQLPYATWASIFSTWLVLVFFVTLPMLILYYFYFKKDLIASKSKIPLCFIFCWLFWILLWIA